MRTRLANGWPTSVNCCMYYLNLPMQRLLRTVILSGSCLARYVRFRPLIARQNGQANQFVRHERFRRP